MHPIAPAVDADLAGCAVEDVGWTRAEPLIVATDDSSKAICSGVKIHWSCEELLHGVENARRSHLPFPRGLETISVRDDQRWPSSTRHLPRHIRKVGVHGGRNGRSHGPAIPTIPVVLLQNTIPTPDGGTHESGLRSALLKGIKDHAERAAKASARRR